MSDDRNKPRIRSALDAGRIYSTGSQSALQFSYDEEKLKQENRYRVKGQAFPKKINCFNWGACILSPIWGLCNNTPIACLGVLLAFIPMIGWMLALLFSLYCGAKGNEWAWANKEWQSLEQFHSVQRKWALWAWAIEIALIIFCFGALSYIMQYAQSRALGF